MSASLIAVAGEIDPLLNAMAYRKTEYCPYRSRGRTEAAPDEVVESGSKRSANGAK
jgi:hypothetical protein